MNRLILAGMHDRFLDQATAAARCLFHHRVSAAGMAMHQFPRGSLVETLDNALLCLNFWHDDFLQLQYFRNVRS